MPLIRHPAIRRVMRVAAAVIGMAPILLCLSFFLFGAWPLEILYLWPLSEATHSSHSDDFKRFVMDGPHWADEDKARGYNPDAVLLPQSVRIMNSKTFITLLAGEGAVLSFKVGPRDLDEILAEDEFEPSHDPAEEARLNFWSRWLLDVTSKDLGAAPSFYLTRGSHEGVTRTLMFVNHERSRAIFLYDNFN